MGPEVEKDQTLRRLWFEGGQGIEYDQITPFRTRLIKAYIDWRDFKIFPWKKGLEADQIPEFWKRVLRNFMSLESEAQDYRRQKEAMKRKKPRGIGERPRDVQVTDGGVAPTEEATQDYKAYRQKKIALQNRQRQQRHRQLQARQQQQQQQQQQQRRQARAAPKRRR